MFLSLVPVRSSSFVAATAALRSARSIAAATTATATATTRSFNVAAAAAAAVVGRRPAYASTATPTTTTTTVAAFSTSTTTGTKETSSTSAPVVPAEVLLQKKLELVLEIESQLLDLAEHTTTKQDVVYNNIGMTTAGDLEALFKDSHLKRDTISSKVAELKQLIEEAKTLYNNSTEASSGVDE